MSGALSPSCAQCSCCSDCFSSCGCEEDLETPTEVYKLLQQEQPSNHQSIEEYLEQKMKEELDEDSHVDEQDSSAEESESVDSSDLDES